MRLRTGRISSVDAAKHTARVRFEDVDDGAEELVSDDLRVLVRRPGDYSLFPVGTLVECMIDDGPTGHGCILGAVYSDEDEPPLDDEGARSIRGEDLRLGDPEATDPVALSPAVKEELDKIKAELDSIQTGLSTHVHPYVDTPVGAATTSPPAAPPYTNGYSPTEPAAENVKAS